MTIIVDTREKVGKNDHILNYFDDKNISWVRQKLDYGDYSFYIPVNESLGIQRDIYFDREIIVERKANLDELSVNLTRDNSRLKKELALAPEHKVLVIENGSYADMIGGKYRGNYPAKSFYGSFHSMWHEFNLPIVFMPDKRYTGMFIKGYFMYYLKNIIK